LGEVPTARDLDQDTCDRRKQFSGDDHPSTLLSARNLAEDQRVLDGAEDDS
jgi:hypothetical protein